MTFGNFILNLREQLNDMRKSDASAITLITDDGIRWTSSKLITVANLAFTEFTRLVATYSKSPVIQQLASITDGLITRATSVTVTAGIASLPTNAVYIVECNLNSDSSPISYISPTKFLTYLGDGELPRSESKFFTIFYDVSSNTKKIYFISNPSGAVDITYVYKKADYVAGDTAVELFFQNVDDILLDVAERICRDREHNWERSKVLDARIAMKLGINLGGQ